MTENLGTVVVPPDEIKAAFLFQKTFGAGIFPGKVL
jgi:hypothetical protein